MKNMYVGPCLSCTHCVRVKWLSKNADGIDGNVDFLIDCEIRGSCGSAVVCEEYAIGGNEDEGNEGGEIHLVVGKSLRRVA